MNSEQAALVRYKIDKAKSTFAEARAYAQDLSVETTANAVYYAMFFAVQGLLQARGVHVTDHAEAREIFMRDVVVPGGIDAELGTFYTTMFARQQDAEHAELPPVETCVVTDWVCMAERFIAAVEHAVNTLLGVA